MSELPPQGPDARPWFVYGTLKPGQLGNQQLAGLVGREVPITLKGYSLWARDGLPGLKVNSGDFVDGVLLYPMEGAEDELVRVIRAFEPSDLYEEIPNGVSHPDPVVALWEGAEIEVRTHLFAHPDKGNPVEWEVRGWAVADDPLFATGFPTIRASIDRLIATDRRSNHTSDPIFWADYSLLLGQYLALCGVLERYLTLSQGVPRDGAVHERQACADACVLDPRRRLADSDPSEVTPSRPGERTIGQQLAWLGKSPEGRMAVAAAQPPRPDTRRRRVYSSGTLEPVEWRGPKNVWKFWYQVRSNAIHRSKNSLVDASLVRDSAVGLAATLEVLLRNQVRGLGDAWESNAAQIDGLISEKLATPPEEDLSEEEGE